MIAQLRSSPADAQHRLKKLAWQIFLDPADRGLLFGFETNERSIEAAGDRIVARVRWLLPENEYGLQIARAYVAPGLNAMDLQDHFAKAIGNRALGKAERLLLVVDGFDLLETKDRLAHLGVLRLAMRRPNVVIVVPSSGIQQSECRFFDRTL